MAGEKKAMTMTESDTEILIERLFDAPRELVWGALTDSEQLGSWWGPTGFVTETESLELVRGGQWRFVMQGPDGQRYKNLITYVDIAAPARLVYKHGGEEDVEPVNFTVTVTLDAAEAERTFMRMRMVFPSKEAKEFVIREYGALDGAAQHLESLAIYLAERQSDTVDKNPVLVLRRVFEAPVEDVFDAFTDPEQMAAWFHPAAWHLSLCEIDLREGGSYFYCMSSDGAPPMYGLWRVRRVERPRLLEFVVSFSDADRRIVRAPFFDHWPLSVLTSITIEPHAGLSGGTVLTMRAEPLDATAEERAAFAAGISSMEQGWGETFGNLTLHLAKD